MTTKKPMFLPDVEANPAPGSYADAVAAELPGVMEPVEAVVRDFESSALTEAEKALFRFLNKVSHDSPPIVAGDLAPLRAHGWTDEQLYYAITVCALFNFYNRWIDATGVHALMDGAHRAGGKRTAANGYVRR